MYIPKKYGASKRTNCPFCDRLATTHNEQQVPVCRLHTAKELEEIRCVCGSYLALEIGTYGPYFSCVNCGNVNFKKGMEMRQPQPKIVEENQTAQKPNRQNEREQNHAEMTVRSDDPRFFD